MQLWGLDRFLNSCSKIIYLIEINFPTIYQILEASISVLKNKEVIYDASHSEISAKAIENLLSI